MSEMNVGNDTRTDGFYKVKLNGQWIFAQWEKTARGKGWWTIPGSEYEKVDEDFEEICEAAMDPYPHKYP